MGLNGPVAPGNGPRRAEEAGGRLHAQRRNRIRAEGLPGREVSAREAQALQRSRQGFSNGEIAREMGINPSSVRVLLWQARRKIGGL